MSLDHATVRRIASLARIRIEDAEVEPLCRELNGILGWIEQLNEIDVTGIAPLTGATNTPNAVASHAPQSESPSVQPADAPETLRGMRLDVVTDGDYAEQVLSNAPERIGDFFVVPKVVE